MNGSGHIRKRMQRNVSATERGGQEDNIGVCLHFKVEGLTLVFYAFSGGRDDMMMIIITTVRMVMRIKNDESKTFRYCRGFAMTGRVIPA